MKNTKLVYIILIVLVGAAYALKRLAPTFSEPKTSPQGQGMVQGQVIPKTTPVAPKDLTVSTTTEISVTPAEEPPTPEITEAKVPEFAKAIEAKMAPYKKKYESQFASEAAAREAIRNLVPCLEMADLISPEKVLNNPRSGIPPEMKSQVPDLPHQLQAGCLKTGKMLVERYPALRNEFERNVLRRASPRARELLRQK